MKNILKKIVLGVFILGVVMMAPVAYAESAPSSLNFTAYKMEKTPVSFPTTFYVKKTTSGKYAYCIKYNRTHPVSSINYTRGSLVSDAGMNYILEEGYKAKNDNDYFVAQTALWLYMVENNLMSSHSYLTKFKSTVDSSSSSYATKIKDMVKVANDLKSYDQSKPTISLADGTFTLSLNADKTAYVSSEVSFKSSEKDYKLELSGAPTGTKYEVTSKGIVVTVPVSSVNSSTTFSLKASASKDIYTSYKYNPSSDSYQIMSVPFKETISVKDEVKFKINIGKAVISKQDVTTGEELPGAHLVVKDSKGEVVEEWVSSDKPYELSLVPGTYTLTETIAPEGYVLSEETITFTVKEDGSTTQVVMKNSPEEKIVTRVEISKQDATTSEEVEGAHLVVKDSTGKVVDEWVSTKTVHIITGLKPGTYTLTETIAPEGYVLSSETITFVVKEDGTTTKVVMKNERDKDNPPEEIVVPSTGSYKSVTSSLIGGLIVIIGSVIITNNLKKKNEE